MSEIEKMYENADILKRKLCTSEMSICTMLCETCSDYTYSYPPFTAEKQLKILCFIVNNKHSVTFHDQIFSGDKLTLEKIQENLAWAINRIWQSLTEKEKEAIRGILRA